MIKKVFSVALFLLMIQLCFSRNAADDNSFIKRISILYTNDLHSNFEPIAVSWISESRKVGGFANIATVVKEAKKSDPNTLYFDAGDFFTGQNFCTLTKGEAVIDVMNHLSVDAACIGNHEFDFGWENMVSQLGRATFPILNGNIFVQKSGELVWNHPWMIIQKGGLKIGVIGLHGKFAFDDTVSDNKRQGIAARDEAMYLQKYIDLVKPQVDLVVLLVHQGIPGRQSSMGAVDISRNLQSDLDLAKKVSGVDILITGHAHQGTPQPLISNGTIIVSTDALGIEVGKLEIAFDTRQKKITEYQNTLKYLYDDETEDDVTTSLSIDKWKKKLTEITGKKVCILSQPLTRSYGEESLLGDMVADAMIFAHPEYDLALMNSGGLREDVKGPVVTAGDLISAFPFPNTVVQLEMKGSVLKELFEHAAALTNGVLQVSEGTIMHYNDTLPIGKRVVLCTIKGKPLEDNSSYKVLTNNFLADGGDGFLGFKKATAKKETYVGILSTMMDYLNSFTAYKPKLSGRLVKLNK